ncbi:MAG: PAS domain-containing protein [Desulfobacterales bacterium]|nr:PAS domain-containing protein [Desulfobacterales bacterium]
MMSLTTEDKIKQLNQQKLILEIAEQKLNEAQKIAQIGHWALDIRENTLTWSDQVYRIFGMVPQEFESTYEAFIEIVHPDDRAYVDHAYKKALDNKSEYDIEHRLLLRDGKLKYVNERCQVKYDENGNASCAVGTVQDITERKKAELALQESENRLRALFDNSNDAILLIENSCIIDCNQKSLDIFGASSKGDIIGKSPVDLSLKYQPDGCESIKEFAKKIQKAKKQIIPPFEWVYAHMDRSPFSAMVSLKSVKIDGKQILQAIICDITLQKQTDVALREIAENSLSKNLLSKWQHLIDLMANIMQIPAAIITKIDSKEIEVLVTSKTDSNPYLKNTKRNLFKGKL